MKGGARPKPAGQAVTRQPRLEFLEVPNVPQPERPMPKRGKGFGPWPAGCRHLWRAWCRMPHTVLWADTDWAYAEVTLHVAARALTLTSSTHMAELRAREKAMGTTYDARRDLRIRYVDPPEPEEYEGVTSLDAYRSL